MCPQFGKKAADPGPFALALKPHCASAVPTDFLFSETALMRSVLRALPENAGLAGLGIKLSAAARSADRVTAFSPLITARIKGPLIDGAPGALAKLAEATLTSYEVAGASSSICGAAGFARHAGSYR